MATVSAQIGAPAPMPLDQVRIRRDRLIEVIRQWPEKIDRARRKAPGRAVARGLLPFARKSEVPTEADQMATKLDELKARLAHYDMLLKGN